MNKIRNVITKQNITDEYVNISSGETLMSEMPDLKYMMKGSDEVIIDYKHFIVMNSEVLMFLSEILPPAELGRVLKLSHLIKTNWNILHNKKTDMPYKQDELAKEIEYTRDKFHNFMQKMYKASVIYKLSGYWDGIHKTIFILNPHLVKAKATLHKDLLIMFEDISKPAVQATIKLNLKNNVHNKPEKGI
jgi:hypothetical protein